MRLSRWLKHLRCWLTGHGPYLRPAVPQLSRRRYCVRCGTLFITEP